MAPAREFQMMALVAALAGLVIALLRIRSGSIDELEREYAAIALSQPASNLSTVATLPGPVPATIENYAWWRREGRRESADHYLVKPAGAFVKNYALVVGFDRQQRVVYKALGNS